MAKTLHEVREQLKQLDEITLLELLKLTSEDLVDRCEDLIEDNQEALRIELEQWFPSSDGSGDSQ